MKSEPFTQLEIEASYDGLRHGKTVRECALIHGRGIWMASELRRGLYDRYGEDLIRKTIDNFVRPSTLTIVKKATEKAKKVLSEPFDIETSDEEAERRQKICNACPKQEQGRCTFCDCPTEDLVRFRLVDCELGAWNDA